jgi:hypothetical protein
VNYTRCWLSQEANIPRRALWKTMYHPYPCLDMLRTTVNQVKPFLGNTVHEVMEHLIFIRALGLNEVIVNTGFICLLVLAGVVVIKMLAVWSEKAKRSEEVEGRVLGLFYFRAGPKK